MTAAFTVTNTDDDIDLIGLNGNVVASAIKANNLTHETPNIPVVSDALLVASHGNFETAATTLATAAVAMMAAGGRNSNSGSSSSSNTNFGGNQPSASFVYVAAVAAANIAAAATTTYENVSFAYDDGTNNLLLGEHDAINRTILLSNVSNALAASVTSTAMTSTATSTPLDVAEWSHFYDLILSWQGICLITVFCTFIVITIIGNTLVILAVITTRRLKTVTNCFVMSLAVADLLVGIFVMPPAVAVHLIGSWQLGWVLCDIWISLDVLLCTASILSLCAISVDRYLAVTQPLTYSRKRRSKRLALIMILIVWILALAITCPPILGWYEPGRRDLSECRYNQNEGYVIFSAMGSFFIPMAVMIYVYARISCVIASRHDHMTDISVHNKKFKRYTSADVDNDLDHDISEQDHSSIQRKQAAARTFSNQTIAKELHEIMLSEGDNGSAEGSHCHSLLTLPTANAKNGCYELTRPASLKRTSTASSTMTTMTSGGGGGGAGGGTGVGLVEPTQWPSRPHSMRQQQHHQQQQKQQHQHHLSTSSAGVVGGIGVAGGMNTNSLLISSPHMPHNSSSSSVTAVGGASGTTLMRTTRAHHHHHHVKSFSNRITSLKKENKTTQTLSIVVGGFIVCWLPFFVYYLITPFLEAHQVSRTVANVLTWLGWFNSAINPFIYAFYSVDFRAAFWRLTCKRFFSGSMKAQFPTNTMSIRR